MKHIKNINCISCDKKKLSKDEIGINIKLIGEKIQNYYCLECLSVTLNITVQDILDKIEEFKEEGCILFK